MPPVYKNNRRADREDPSSKPESHPTSEILTNESMFLSRAKREPKACSGTLLASGASELSHNDAPKTAGSSLRDEAVLGKTYTMTTQETAGSSLRDEAVLGKTYTM